MIIYPAIDLRSGRVVRLKQGRAEEETIYGDDPALIASRWQSEGAEWLHVVNLDGAFGRDASANGQALSNILRAISIPVQFGGGLRNLSGIESVIHAGAARVVIGTAAIENPDLVSDAVVRFGAERVSVGIDARAGLVSTRGWREQSQISALGLARQMRESGIRRIIYTDIVRDGMMQGVDAGSIAQFAREAGVGVIASGGVAGLQDVRAARAYREIEGLIIGQALYQGRVNLREAVDAGKENYPLS